MSNNQIKNFTVSSQISYERKVVSQLKESPKLFHSYIRHRKVGRPGVGPMRLECGTLSDNAIDMAEVFVSSFSSVFSGEIPDTYGHHQHSNSIMPTIDISQQQVKDLLLELDPNSSPGLDGVHPHGF